MATAATAGSSSPPTPHADDSPEPPLPGEKVYVAVGREVAESRATLLWALHKFPRGAGAGAASFVLLHVYSPPKLLPFLGARIPAAQVREQELAAHKEMELQRVNDSLDQYLHLCAQGKIHAEKLVVESDDVAQGLVELISEHNVTALVMGAASDKHYTKKMKIPKSRKARFVELQADPSCKIWFICKGTLVCHRNVDKALGSHIILWTNQQVCQKCGVLQTHGYANQSGNNGLKGLLQTRSTSVRRTTLKKLVSPTIISSISSGS